MEYCPECNGVMPNKPAIKTCSKKCARSRQLKQMAEYNIRRHAQNKYIKDQGMARAKKEDCKKYLSGHSLLLRRLNKHWSTNSAYQKLKPYLNSLKSSKPAGLL